MIEVLALAGAVTKIAGGISSAVQAGRDVHTLMPHFGKLAKLEADINLAEQGRHKGPLGRLSSSEEEGFAIAQAKMAHKDAMDTLRSHCKLYGPPGMWDLVVKEQAAARMRQKEALEAQAAARDKLFWGITLALGVVIFIAGTSLMIWGVDKLANG
tara:strand:- start:410 stop:877 length:468 start_codon:yes stop_codon:yes gene_type:complete